VVVLTGIAAHPERRVDELPLLGARERHQVLARWSGTEAEVPAATFPGLFEAQARRTPDAAALVCEDVTLSYRELNARANRLARQLACRGAGPEQIVALALPRCAGMIVAMLAVAKAGAAYLPVDPGLPGARTRVWVGEAALSAEPWLWVTNAKTRAATAASASADAPTMPTSKRRECVGRPGSNRGSGVPPGGGAAIPGCGAAPGGPDVVAVPVPTSTALAASASSIAV